MQFPSCFLCGDCMYPRVEQKIEAGEGTRPPVLLSVSQGHTMERKERVFGVVAVTVRR